MANKTPPKIPTTMSRRALLANMGAATAAAIAPTLKIPLSGLPAGTEIAKIMLEQAANAIMDKAVTVVLQLLAQQTTLPESFVVNTAREIREPFFGNNQSLDWPENLSTTTKAEKLQDAFRQSCLAMMHLLDLEGTEIFTVLYKINPNTRSKDVLVQPLLDLLYEKYEQCKSRLIELERQELASRKAEANRPVFKARNYYDSFLQWPSRSQKEKAPDPPLWWHGLSDKAKLAVHAMGLYAQHHDIPHTGLLTESWAIPYEGLNLKTDKAVDIARDNLDLSMGALVKKPFFFFMTHYGNISRKAAYSKVFTVTFMAAGLSHEEAKGRAKQSLEISEIPPILSMQELDNKDLPDADHVNYTFYQVALTQPLDEIDKATALIKAHHYFSDVFKGSENGLQNISAEGDILNITLTRNSPAHGTMKEMEIECYKWSREWFVTLPYSPDPDHLLGSRPPMLGKDENAAHVIEASKLRL